MNKQTITLAILTGLISTSAFAISNKKLIKICSKVGNESVISQAEAYGCQIDEDNIYVDEIDNRKYNPSKYLWFQADVIGGCDDHETVTQLVQYYDGDCF